MAKRKPKPKNRYLILLVFTLFFFLFGYWLGHYTALQSNQPFKEEASFSEHPVKNLEQELEQLYQIIEEKELRLILLKEGETP